eukprot:GHVP01019949.1.p1 GENE.GHVP01019949.1~~GHVP01019949.1.p1  ORF type:complete len:210 (+),score=12.08 GHVP01019949.1:132-761(+)
MVDVTANDILLLFALSYSSIDILSQWNDFAKCYRPMQLWLLICYLSLILFRAVHILGMWYITSTPSPINSFLSRSNAQIVPGPPKWLQVTAVGIIFPFFSAWTIVGTVWLVQLNMHTPNCLPPGSQDWFFIFWLVICYIWILIYIIFIGAAFKIESSLRQLENDIRSLQNDDLIERWGHVDLFFFNWHSVCQTWSHSWPNTTTFFIYSG